MFLVFREIRCEFCRYTQRRAFTAQKEEGTDPFYLHLPQLETLFGHYKVDQIAARIVRLQMQPRGRQRQHQRTELA